ncbi:MAG TPA: hypothetical protein PLW35_02630 [Verrucomicrobiota bacterium]|mgnify:CR=1 FL=1|nr:hypothetical protein [Verrucomicrobiota bacterium]
MRCAEFESWLLEHAEGSLPEEKLPLLIAHLNECAQCRQSMVELQSLDRTLSRVIQKPRLSADFNERLWQRIRLETGETGAAQPELDQPRRIGVEYEAGLPVLHRGKALATDLIDAAGLGLLVGGFAYALYRHMPEFLQCSVGLREWDNLNLAVVASACTIACVIGLLIWDWLKPASERSLF